MQRLHLGPRVSTLFLIAAASTLAGPLAAEPVGKVASEALKRATIAKTQRKSKADAPAAAPEDIRALVGAAAHDHGVPETLAHRVVLRESRYNPGLRGRGHYGLMQISLGTARQMGYAGAPQGLLDARTNLAYGMPYLANAWLVSGGNEARAMSLYSRGYYYEAKRKGLVRSLRTGGEARRIDPLEGEALAVAQ